MNESTPVSNLSDLNSRDLAIPRIMILEEPLGMFGDRLAHKLAATHRVALFLHRIRRGDPVGHNRAAGGRRQTAGQTHEPSPVRAYAARPVPASHSTGVRRTPLQKQNGNLCRIRRGAWHAPSSCTAFHGRTPYAPTKTKRKFVPHS